MRTNILKFGVLLVAAGMLVLIFRLAPKSQTGASLAKTPAGREASTAPPAKPGDQPAKNEHDLKVLEMALTKKPGHTPVLMQMAKLEEGKGSLDKATEHLREIVKQEPGNLEAKLELGRVLYQRGDIQGALDQTQAILKAQPNNPDALYNLGAIYGNLGNAKLAREYWGRLVAIDPKSDSGKRAQQMMTQLPASQQ
jgi:tetratricopeptide (TPR) repeat protein